MLPHAVEIAGDNRHLCKERGFLAVYAAGERLGRLPLDDLSMVLACGHGITWSNELLVSLAERCVPVVICSRTMLPVAFVWSLVGHHRSSERIQHQIAASTPTRKRLWQALVCAKISMQAQHVALRGHSGGHLQMLSRSVKSGDPDNTEAKAARVYWLLCFGMDFKRDRHSPGINGLLNYGYTVLRAIVARSLMLAGLHPAFGVFHRNARNPMPLVDDLMEPFRPVVDMLVLHLQKQGVEELTPQAKQVLQTVSTLDMETAGKCSTVGNCIRSCADSLAAVYCGERRDLVLPEKLILLHHEAEQCRS